MLRIINEVVLLFGFVVMVRKGSEKIVVNSVCVWKKLKNFVWLLC